MILLTSSQNRESRAPVEAEELCFCPDALISALCIFPVQEHPCLAVAPSPGSGDVEAQLAVALPGDTLRPFAPLAAATEDVQAVVVGQPLEGRQELRSVDVCYHGVPGSAMSA